jgi:hypothetical protein
MDGVVEKIVLTAIAIVIVSALLSTVNINTDVATKTGGALENLSASAKSGVSLTPLVFAFIAVGLGVGAMVAAFRG